MSRNRKTKANAHKNLKDKTIRHQRKLQKLKTRTKIKRVQERKEKIENWDSFRQDKKDRWLEFYNVNFTLPFRSVPKKHMGVLTDDSHIRIITEKKTKDHERKLNLYAQEILKDHEPFTGPVELCIYLEFNPKDFDFLIDGVTDHNVGDCDNHIKSLQDSLNGVLYTDDKLVVALSVRKRLVNTKSCIKIDAIGSYR